MRDLRRWMDDAGFSAATRETYERIMIVLTKHTGNLRWFRSTDFYKFLEKNPQWGPAHQWVVYCCIRSFIRWKFGATHPLLRMRFRREESGPQRTLRPYHFQALIESCGEDQTGRRDFALMWALYDTGLRSSELIALDLESVDFTLRRIHVRRAKRGGWQTIPMSEPLMSVLIDWLPIRAEIAAMGETALFVSVGGNTPGHRLTRAGLRLVLKYRGDKIGLPLSAHDFRRGWVLALLMQGVPTRTIQLLGGWRHIAMVEKYSADFMLEDLGNRLPFASGVLKAGSVPCQEPSLVERRVS